MHIEPELKLAIALHSSPGVYALLLGSGLSSAAGVPTGWQVTLDLIRKLAATQASMSSSPTCTTRRYESVASTSPCALMSRRYKRLSASLASTTRPSA